MHLPGRREFLFNSSLAAVNGDRIPAAQPADTVVVIADLDFNPASGNQDEEYIQLQNTNAFAADISGWTLAGAIEFKFRPGTVIPAGGSLYVSPNVNAFRARAASPQGEAGALRSGRLYGPPQRLG